MATPLIVCRIAWMDHYRGVTAADTPAGGGAYVEERGFGHEAFNFEPLRNEYFGYVQATGAGINLSRLGVRQAGNRLDGMTVAWVAKRPTGGTVVVGWYRNATGFAEYQPAPATKGRDRQLPNGSVPKFLLRTKDAVLLDRDERVLEVPRGTATVAGIGQSNIWYPDAKAAAPILKYIAAGGRTAGGRTQQTRLRLQDVERRLRVEKAAMNAAAAWFSDRGYDVKDVSMDRLGWDLEARLKRARLLIEVKGTSLAAGAAVVEVTPNEYAKMTGDENRASYRLCVVTSCEGEPEVAVFAWSPDGAVWTTGDGARRLQIEARTAARISMLAG